MLFHVNMVIIVSITKEHNIIIMSVFNYFPITRTSVIFAFSLLVNLSSFAQTNKTLLNGQQQSNQTDSNLTGQPPLTVAPIRATAKCQIVSNDSPRYIINGGIFTEEEMYFLNPQKILSIKYIKPSEENYRLYGGIRDGAFDIKTQEKPFLKHKKQESVRTLDFLLSDAKAAAAKE